MSSSHNAGATPVPTGAIPLVQPGLSPRAERLAGLRAARKPAPSRAAIAQRRWVVMLTKRMLPVVALALLATVALWPEFGRETNGSRFTFRRGMVEAESGQLVNVRYHGIDEQDRPYTVTADQAQQVSPERVNLTAPVGDVLLGGSDWMQAHGRQGVFMQHAGQLDLSGEVTLYRDSGLTMTSDDASLDLHAGAAASASRVHAEGPFGTLDAQGFSLVDRGAVIHFTGASRLVLNGQKSPPPPTAAPAPAKAPVAVVVVPAVAVPRAAVPQAAVSQAAVSPGRPANTRPAAAHPTTTHPTTAHPTTAPQKGATRK